MKTSHFFPGLLIAASLVSACSSTPTTTSLLEQTRRDYVSAQNNPKVESYAAREMMKAGEALDLANAAASKDETTEKIDKLAYLAKQKIALTEEVAKQKSAEADVVNAGRERDQLLLSQRTVEANRARAITDEAVLVAMIAKGDAADADRSAQIARNDAAELARRNEIAQSETAEALRTAQMARADAANAERLTKEAQARTASLEAQLADLAAKKTARGLVITLGDVLFGTDLARLNSDGTVTMQKLAHILQQNPERTVLIEGFTDSTGSAAHNQELSERRATAVESALRDLGVAPGRIGTRGYGETHPVATNDTAQNRQLNRRVEIIISNEGGRIAQR